MKLRNFITYFIPFSEMTTKKNPWQVESIQAFSIFQCPECRFDSKEEEIFQDHAIENHPLSFVLFGKEFKKEQFDEIEELNDNWTETDDAQNDFNFNDWAGAYEAPDTIENLENENLSDSELFTPEFGQELTVKEELLRYHP